MNSASERRLRRLRRTPALRRLRRETLLAPQQLIQPVFVVERESDVGPIESMPGVSRVGLEMLPRQIERIATAGIGAVLLFGIPAQKSADAASACNKDGIVPLAVRRIRRMDVPLAIITDVCVCSYTDHGHCGIVESGSVVNDKSVELLTRMAVAHAEAGADVVAPSAMMDRMVAGIRHGLDENGLSQVGILSYAVKFASSFYGPFRDAADSTPQFGDRRSYQMDPANLREAIAEARTDVDEGADMIMVKPAMPYLDVIRAVRESCPDVPLAAYQVSGEYAMIQAAARQGWLDERKVALESLTAIRRSGADVIITYWAAKAAGWLDESEA